MRSPFKAAADRDPPHLRWGSDRAGFGIKGAASIAAGTGSMPLENSSVTFTEAVAVIFPGRRRYRRPAEAGMPFSVGSAAGREVAPSCFDSVMKALAGNLRPGGGRRGRVVGHGPWMIAGSQNHWQNQCCNCESFSHGVPRFSEFAIVRLHDGSMAITQRPRKGRGEWRGLRGRSEEWGKRDGFC